MRKKIETQKEQPEENVRFIGRYGGDMESNNFFLFSPPEFSLVEVVEGNYL